MQTECCRTQVDLRSLCSVYGSFGDVFADNPKEREEQIAKVVQDAAARSAERAQKELKLLPYRT